MAKLPPEPSARRRSLRDRLLARAYLILSRLRLGAALTEPLCVSAADDAHEVGIRAGPAGRARPSRQAFPGLFFSPLEAAVWHALADGPLAGKALARATGQRHATSLRVLLHNLVQREVLTRTPAGYARARGKTRKNKGTDKQA